MMTIDPSVWWLLGFTAIFFFLFGVLAGIFITAARSEYK